MKSKFHFSQDSSHHAAQCHSQPSLCIARLLLLLAISVICRHYILRQAFQTGKYLLTKKKYQYLSIKWGDNKSKTTKSNKWKQKEQTNICILLAFHVVKQCNLCMISLWNCWMDIAATSKYRCCLKIIVWYNKRVVYMYMNQKL